MTKDILYLPAISYGPELAKEPELGEGQELLFPIDEHNIAHYLFTVAHGDDVDEYIGRVYDNLPDRVKGILPYSLFREVFSKTNSELSTAYRNRYSEFKSAMLVMGSSKEGLESAISLYQNPDTHSLIKERAKQVIADAAEGFRNFAGLDLDTTPGQYCIEKMRELKDIIANEEA